jgi:tRNA modification GTPase
MAVMGALKAAGFRDALPGEFTFRAFMNGKLDLTRAESVMEIVSAKTGLSREHAVGRLSGVLEREIQSIKDLLVQVLAETELYLDYSEEEAAPPHDSNGADSRYTVINSGNSVTNDSNGIYERNGTAAVSDEAAGRLPGRAQVEEALTRLRVLAASYRRERLYQDGALVVIAGRPNAGKSSLFNLLLKEERSIVTAIPGTTRDWIESWISIEGIPIRLADTAGLRDIAIERPGQTSPVDQGDCQIDPGDQRDLVEQIGILRSRELLAQADLVLYVIDGSEGITGEDRAFFRDWPQAAAGGKGEGAALIAVWNKVDVAAMEGAPWRERPIEISCKNGSGISALTAAIASALEAAFGGSDGAGDGRGSGHYGDRRNTAETGGAAPGTARQKELVDAAETAVREALALAEKGEPLDFIAPLLREGVNSLGEITGEVSTADILDAMFSRFCVGK